jgi:hypothetical protein
VVASEGPATAAIEAYTSHNEITVELWVTPGAADPESPGRLFSVGRTSSNRSVVVSQGYWKGGENQRWEARARTSADYGNPLSADAEPATAVTHLVFRRDASGNMELWVNGVLSGWKRAAGDSMAAADGVLSIGSDADGNAPWQGTFHLVAVYERALTDEELAQNHRAGPNAEPASPTDPPTKPGGRPTWTRLQAGSSILPMPTEAGERREKQQTASLTGDFDGDGDTDFLVAGRRQPGPSVTLYRRHPGGWTTSALEPGVLNVEAGGATHDVDGDGDLDVVLGGDSQSNEIWWWQNPGAAAVGDPWRRFTVKSAASEGRQHHDMVFAQLDGDAPLELAYWVQKPRPDGDRLFVADIPANPTSVADWPAKQIHQGARPSEGLAAADVDGDGDTDLVGGGHWFRRDSAAFTVLPVDPAATLSRASVGQVVPGGWPEIVLDSGDEVGALAWYRWDGAAWVGNLLDAGSRNGHSLDLGDVDGDGNLDILSGEMAIAAPDARLRVFYGDGTGGFGEQVVATGVDNHESRLVDLDADGDLDILGKPYSSPSPGLSLWLNGPPSPPPAGAWARHSLDDARPWKAPFMEPADIDRDGDLDIVAGGWWYRNPGSLAGQWTRRDIGSPMHNMMAVHDFDGDGDLDVLGTTGKNFSSSEMAWARNEGDGTFTVLTNVATVVGDGVPQGAAVARFTPGGPLQVALAFDDGPGGTQMLTVPADPSTQRWTHSTVHPFSTGEEMLAEDIDGDRDVDLFIGSDWLRNDQGTWTKVPVYVPVAGEPDRSRLVDVDGDGDKDAVVGQGHDPAGLLAWYERGPDPAAPWIPHTIANLVHPQSLDAADLDGDGDIDLVAGEHNLENPAAGRAFVFWNDGGGTFRSQQIGVGDEHHDGTQFADLDRDGDLDVVSLGWSTKRTFVYENPAN